MNPWREKLGCEVNVCSARQCDPGRMEICALRHAYQERVARLQLHYSQARSKYAKSIIARRLKMLEAKCPDE